jgi:hypothetical protein
MAASSRTKDAPKPGGRLSANLVKAMSHPVRVQIMTRLDGKVASPRALAASLGLPIGMIELVRTESSRGSVEHFYRGIERPYLTGQSWPHIPTSVRRSVSDVVLSDIAADINESVGNDTFDRREDRHLSRLPLVLDDAGWEEVRNLVDATLDAVIEAQARAAARMIEADDDRPSIDAEAVFLFFERAGQGAVAN